MLNLIAIMGRLTANPELRYTQNNIPVCAFTLAVERPYATNGQRQADFIDIVAWRNTAEFVSKYFSKGQLIAVDGSLQPRTYEDKNGNKHKVTEVVANNVHFAERKQSDTQGYTPSGSDINVRHDDFEPVEEDLPF